MRSQEWMSSFSSNPLNKTAVYDNYDFIPPIFFTSFEQKNFQINPLLKFWEKFLVNAMHEAKLITMLLIVEFWLMFLLNCWLILFPACANIWFLPFSGACAVEPTVVVSKQIFNINKNITHAAELWWHPSFKCLTLLDPTISAFTLKNEMQFFCSEKREQ